MLGPIRTLLGPMKARLQGYIKRGKTILENPVDTGDLDKEETELDDLIHQFSMNINLLEQFNQEWSTPRSTLLNVTDERAAEEKEYLWATDGADGMIEVLLDSREISSRIEGHLVRILRKVEKSETILIQQPVTSVVPSGSPTDTDDKNSVQVSLASLHLMGAFSIGKSFGTFLRPQFMSKTSQV